MLEDFNRELEKRGINAAIATGDSTEGNPELLYLVGCKLPRGGIYVKKCYEPPILVVSNIDFGSATHGHVTRVETYDDYGYELLAKQDPKKAYRRLVGKILRSFGVEGSITLYGRQRASNTMILAQSLRKKGYSLILEEPPTALESTMMTKSSEEVKAIESIGRKTCDVIIQVMTFLQNCKKKDGQFITKNQVLTVGHIKRLIRGLLAESSLLETGETIFATAPGSADPHYTGVESEVIHGSKPIVFDIFPQGRDGYCFDVTRTFCLAPPNSKIKKMYDTVLEAQTNVLDKLRSSEPASKAMEEACIVFEHRGYTTPRRNRSIQKGFIHSLGHGIGLTIGERPFLSLYSEDQIQDDQVFTVEPGLYDPKIGGVRIEDVVVMKNGKTLNLTTIEKLIVI